MSYKEWINWVNNLKCSVKLEKSDKEDKRKNTQAEKLENSWGKMVHFNPMKSITALSMMSLNLWIKKTEFTRLDKKARHLYMLPIRTHFKYEQIHVLKRKGLRKITQTPKESWGSYVNFSQSRLKGKENCQVMIKSDTTSWWSSGQFSKKHVFINRASDTWSRARWLWK